MIRLHIERLVVPDDLSLGDRSAGRIRAGVVTELERLVGGMTQAGVRPRSGRSAVVRGDDLALVELQTDVDVGRAIGRCIYGGVARVV